MSAAELALHQQLHSLYCDHHGWLQAWLCKKLGCPHHAADVAQNTFLRVLTGREALHDVQQPRAWLTTTAKRLIIDEARRRQIEQAYLAAAAALGEEDCHPSPEQTLEAVQSLLQLSAVLEDLPRAARTAFVRHYLDGETHATVAAELGVSTKMVQKHLARVLLQARRVGIEL